MELPHVVPETVLLGKYRIRRLLGMGGMGVVMCAEHIALRKQVAIKVLHPNIAHVPEMTERFSREAVAAARIAGEHVPHVLDVGWLEGGSPYIVMEYLEGEDLSDYRFAHPDMPIEEAIDYIVQAGFALMAAHRVGIVHRDVKPANLFRTVKQDGSALIKVLDFGISKFIDDEVMREITATETVMGSFPYMSPEQMRSAKNVDQQTDIYALGVCLYELLTGTQPYVASSSMALAMRIGSAPPDPIRRHRPDVPPVLAKVIETAYAKRRADRYTEVEAFLLELEPFASEGTRARVATIQRVAPSMGEGKHRASRVAPQAGSRLDTATTVPQEDTSPTTVSTRVVVQQGWRWTAPLSVALSLLGLAFSWTWTVWRPGALPVSAPAVPVSTHSLALGAERVSAPSLPASVSEAPPVPAASASAEAKLLPPAAATAQAMVKKIQPRGAATESKGARLPRGRKDCELPSGSRIPCADGK